MRILFFGIISIFLCGACNNNLTTIGQDLINNGSSMKVETYMLNETYTIKIDSFPTSSGYYSNSYALRDLFVGRYEDLYSGTTIAEAYFQIAPTNTPSVPLSYVLDSVTFNFTYNGKIWGDTIKPTIQTLELWQLSELPALNKDDDNLLFSNDSLPVARKLATTQFIPRKTSIRNARFKLPHEFGLELSNKMKDGDPIFKDLPWSFLRYFKGLVIKPGVENNCIFTISPSSDSLYMRFHYRQAESKVNIDIRLNSKEYLFNSYKNIPPARFTTLTNQQQKVSFREAGNVAVLQGLNGYAIRLDLHRPPGIPQYSTIIKAEIELRPIVLTNDRITLPQTISTYVSNDNNEIVAPLYNTSTNAVTGTFVPDPTNRENNRYVFDVTDYYQRLATDQTIPEKGIPVLLGLPSNNALFPTGANSSFNRVIIDRIPVLKIYFATYN